MIAEIVEGRNAASAALAANGAYVYLDEWEALVFTCRTGTTVNDLRVLLMQ